MVEVSKVVNSKRILVVFDNTGIEKWTFSSSLRKGNVHDPSLPRTSPNKPSIKKGDIFASNYHGSFEVVNYQSAQEVTVRFIESGEELITSVTRIKEGIVKPAASAPGKPKIVVPSDMEAGYRHTTNNYGVLEIVKYHNARQVDITFVQTGFSTTVSAHEIRRGEIWDKLMPVIHGVGYHGIGTYKSTYTDGSNPFEPGRVKCRAYSAWSNMLTRCYSQTNHLRQPSYKGVVVDEEWHNFQNFAEWFYAQNWRGMQLDKDLLCGGHGKRYGPDTCVMLPEAYNKALNRETIVKITSTGKYHLSMNLTLDTVDEAVNIFTTVQLNMRKTIFQRLRIEDPQKNDAQKIIQRIIRKRVK
jgi:hypothetical protein